MSETKKMRLSPNTIDNYYVTDLHRQSVTEKKTLSSPKQANNAEKITSTSNTEENFYLNLLWNAGNDEGDGAKKNSEASESDTDQEKCNNLDCTKQSAELKKENVKLVKELKETRKKYRTLLQVNVNKDLRLQKLEDILQQHSIPFNSQDVHAEQFDSFKKFLPEKVLASLRSLDFDARSDSTFLSTCITALYKDDLKKLAQRTVTGTNERTIVLNGKRTVLPAKNPVSPQKIIILSKIFDERVEALPEIDDFDKMTRKKGMNKVLAKVIDRICVDRLGTARANKKLGMSTNN